MFVCMKCCRKFYMILLLLMVCQSLSAQKDVRNYTEVDIVGLMMKLDDTLQVEELMRELGYEYRFRTGDESLFTRVHLSQGMLSFFWITSSMDVERRLKKVRLVSGFSAEKLLNSFKRIGFHIDSVSEGERKVYFRKGDFTATMEQDISVPCMIMEFYF